MCFLVLPVFCENGALRYGGNAKPVSCITTRFDLWGSFVVTINVALFLLLRLWTDIRLAIHPNNTMVLI
jgi:hypothetical protein